VCHARDDLIEILDEVDNAFDDSSREYKVYITKDITFWVEGWYNPVKILGPFRFLEMAVGL